MMLRGLGEVEDDRLDALVDGRLPREAELGEDRVDHFLDGSLGQDEARGDRRVVLPLGHLPENVALARRNLAPWGDRCEVLEAGIWPEDGEIRYHRLAGGTAGHHVADVPDDAAGVAIAPAVSPGTLLARSGPEAVVDFAKIDIEGAEWALLADPRFSALRATTIVLEYHVEGCPSPDPRAAAEEALKTAGFEITHTQRKPAFGAGVVWGYRSAQSNP